MAQISFKKPTQAPTPAVAPQTTAVTIPAAQPLTIRDFSSPQLQGEFTRSDVAIPYLSLGQKTGGLTDEHPTWLGQWIFDKSTPLGSEIRVVFCSLSKRYEEDLPYGSEDIPRRYDHKAEADKDEVTVRDVADLDLLIETTELSGQAAFSVVKLNYVACRYTVRSSAYGATVKFLLKDWTGWLKGDLRNGFYKMAATKRTGPKGSWYAPAIKPDGATSEELKTKIRA